VADDALLEEFDSLGDVHRSTDGAWTEDDGTGAEK